MRAHLSSHILSCAQLPSLFFLCCLLIPLIRSSNIILWILRLNSMIFLGSGKENYIRWTKNDKHLSVFSFHPYPMSLYLSAFWLDSPLPLRYTDFSRSIALYCNLFSLILKSFRKTQKNNTNDDLFLPVSSRILKLPTFFKVFIKLCAQQLLVLFTSPFFPSSLFAFVIWQILSVLQIVSDVKHLSRSFFSMKNKERKRKILI